MATGEVDVANSALAKLGADRIISLEDDTREARLIKAQFSNNRDDLLRAHPWNFAIKRADLVAYTTTPEWNFDFEFAVPADCVRILESDDPDSEWQKEGKYVRANSDALSIRYISKITEVGKWDSCFCEVLATKLAADICFAITQNASLKKQLFDEYLQKLREARSYDGQEGASRQVRAMLWRNQRN